jgi:hypothetical protein
MEKQQTTRIMMAAVRYVVSGVGLDFCLTECQQHSATAHTANTYMCCLESTGERQDQRKGVWPPRSPIR